MTLSDRTSKIAIAVADYFSNPLAILAFPVICGMYIWLGGVVDNLTLILSILAISLTQLVLRAQNVDAEAYKLQIAELVKATPKARNEVAKEGLTHEEIVRLRQENKEDDLSKKL